RFCFFFSLLWLWVGHQCCRSTASRARRDSSLPAHLLLHTRGNPAHRGSRWSQGNLHRTRAVHPALVLQERRGTLRPKQRTGPAVQRDNEGVPPPRRLTP